MAILNVSVPDSVMDKFRAVTKCSNAEVVRDALTFFVFCVDESAKDRLILSATPDGENMTRLKHPALEKCLSHGLRSKLEGEQFRRDMVLQAPLEVGAPLRFKKKPSGFNL